MDMSTLPAIGQSASSNQSNSMPDGFYTPYLTLVLPNATTVSALPPQPTSAKHTPALAPITEEQEEAYLHSHDSLPSTGGGTSVAHRIDFERLKFRVVFIFWPALIGITMAL